MESGAAGQIAEQVLWKRQWHQTDGRTDGRRPGRREERTSKALEEPGKKGKRKSSLAEEEQATESTTSYFSSIFAVAAACAAAAAAIVKQVLHAYSRGKKGRKVGRGPGSPSLSSPPTKSRTRDSAPAAGAREEKPFRRHHFVRGRKRELAFSVLGRSGRVGRSVVWERSPRHQTLLHSPSSEALPASSAAEECDSDPLILCLDDFDSPSSSSAPLAREKLWADCFASATVSAELALA